VEGLKCNQEKPQTGLTGFRAKIGIPNPPKKKAFFIFIREHKKLPFTNSGGRDRPEGLTRVAEEEFKT
jgi:hypothetical protein